MTDVTALGELLVDFTECGTSDAGMRLFEQNPGGAPANVAAAIARQGLSAAFIGKVGDDMHGRFLRCALERSGVCADGLVTGPEATTLAFVARDENGERCFTFLRDPGADTCLKPAELNQQLIRATRVLHIGSLSLTRDPARSATWQALITAKSTGAVVTYDPNYRAPLWESDEHACDQIRSILPIVDIIKLSEDDMPYAAGIDEADTAVQVLRNEGVPLIIITLGARGAIVATRDDSRVIPAYPTAVVDSTGAGDAFFGGFIAAFIKAQKGVQDVTIDDMAAFAKRGAATAAISLARRGGMPAMPTAAEVEEFIAAHE